jgi:hypothetical protein
MTAKTLTFTASVVGVAVLSACNASAEPHNSRFPDLSGYTLANIADYRIDTTSPGMPSSGTYFLTPDGISCNFTSTQAQCTGNNFPAVPPATSNPAAGINRVNWIGTETGLQHTNDPISSGNTALGQTIKTLPPFHSIEVTGIKCGVDDNRTTACQDPKGRGFILSPSWSGWLQHV